VTTSNGLPRGGHRRERAPYFHNGSAATLEDVVDHYAAMFKVVFTDGERHDLAAFLRAL
jgi:cytochrome c peroxidase